MMKLAWHQGVLEVKQFARTRQSLVFIALMPAALMLLFGRVYGFDLNGGIPMRSYYASGMLAFGPFMVGFGNLASIIPIERGRGVLKRYRATPMPRWVYFAGKVFAVAVLSAAQTVVLLAIAVFVLGLDPPGASGWLTFAWVSVLGLSSFTLLGIAASSIPRSPKAASAVITPFSIVLPLISGVFFPYLGLPEWMRQVAALLPLKWVVQGMHAAFLPPSFASIEAPRLALVALVLTGWCLLAFVLCLATFRFTHRRDG